MNIKIYITVNADLIFYIMERIENVENYRKYFLLYTIYAYKLSYLIILTTIYNVFLNNKHEKLFY